MVDKWDDENFRDFKGSQKSFQYVCVELIYM
jgi:hypothetical protein